MRPLCIEPDQILHEDDIELLWFQQLMGMVIHKLLLDGSVESLAVRIHLRSLWVGVIMREVQFFQPLREMLLEL